MRGVEAFRRLIARQLGLRFDDAFAPSLREVLERRAAQRDVTVEAYLVWLERESPVEELRALAEEVTITETFFFRGTEQLAAFVAHALPEAASRARAQGRRPQVLSAACASGEEPYTLAILAREAGVDVAITGADINAAALARARAGRYSSWSLRDTPTQTQAQWFRAEGRELVLDPEVVRTVTLVEINLASERDHEVWRPGRFDVIFCRNVLMYFTVAQARAAVERLTEALVPGGLLFLGHAETLRGLSHDYALVHTDGAFYYRRHDVLGSSMPPPPPSPVPHVERESEDASWVEIVQGASRRIEALAEQSRQRSPVAPVERWDLGPSLELLRRERFAEALATVAALPAESAQDPDVLLLHAVLWVHSGRGQEAEAACARLLDRDGLDAGAHYVLALARELAGDLVGAMEQDRLAAHIDPAFAMPRLHLALLAARGGRREEARRDLEQARHLLAAEDPSRVLLFGGGFGREALVLLCERRLEALGAAP